MLADSFRLAAPPELRGVPSACPAGDLWSLCCSDCSIPESSQESTHTTPASPHPSTSTLSKRPGVFPVNSGPPSRPNSWHCKGSGRSKPLQNPLTPLTTERVSVEFGSHRNDSDQKTGIFADFPQHIPQRRKRGLHWGRGEGSHPSRYTPISRSAAWTAAKTSPRSRLTRGAISGRLCTSKAITARAVLIWSCTSSTSTRISLAIRSGVRSGGTLALAGHLECSQERTSCFMQPLHSKTLANPRCFELMQHHQVKSATAKRPHRRPTFRPELYGFAQVHRR